MKKIVVALMVIVLFGFMGFSPSFAVETAKEKQSPKQKKMCLDELLKKKKLNKVKEGDKKAIDSSKKGGGKAESGSKK